MKLIIAGGRKFQPKQIHKCNIKFIFDNNDITEVVSGGAKGADAWGEYIAQIYDVPVKVFPAQWDLYGKSAGHIRNKEMAKYADAVALFPGGKGTDGMHHEAIVHDLQIFDFRKEEN